MTSWIMAGAYTLVLTWSIACCWRDIRKRVIPNALTIGSAAVVLLAKLGYGGGRLFLESFAAGAVAGVFLLVPFLLHGAGGGDVKMMFAAGAIVGWSRILYLLWHTSVAGLLLGFVMLMFGRLDGSRLKHYVRCAVDWRYDRKAGAAALPSKENNKVRIPFSIAITIGMLFALFV